MRVKAAGVGPWDTWIGSGKSVISQPLPLTLGSDLSGVVEATGPGVTSVQRGEEVFGVTNADFIGTNAEYALACAGMIAAKPRKLGHIEAASMPVVAVTAWQMLFERAHVAPGQTVLVHGGAGNVGAYAVQLARMVRARVIATAATKDIDYVYGLDADEVIDFRADRFEDGLEPVDVVIDTVGGDVQRRSLSVLKPGGILVSAVSEPDAREAMRRGVRGIFLLVKVTTSALAKIAAMIDADELSTNVGVVLPLDQASKAHEMIEGLWSRPRGKIVLKGLA